MLRLPRPQHRQTLGVVAGLLAATAPANASADISGKEMTDALLSVTAKGTQVGSEGVMAPATADDHMKVSGYKAVVVLIGANDYGFADTSSSGRRE